MRIFIRMFLVFILSGLFTTSFAASLSGVVYDGESEQPIADALVWAYHVNGESQIDSSFYEVASDENGHYYFDFLPAGLFRITAHHPDYYDASSEVESVDGEMAITKDFKLTPRKHHYNNSVSGMISDCNSGNPLPNVYVVLYISADRPCLLTTISDREGNYQFKNIPPNVYNLIAFKGGYKTYELERKLDIKCDTHIENLDFVMLPKTNDAPGRLTGYVYANDGMVHLVDSVKTVRDLLILPPPVYPARIELFRITDDNAIYYHSTWTNPDGSYRLRGITPGDFLMVVRARGYKKYSEHISIQSGYNEKIVYLKPYPQRYGVISGNVIFDKSEEPVAGALINFISLSDRNHFRRTYTNENGDYKARLKPGRYVVSCAYLGYNLLDTISVKDTLSLYDPVRCGYYREYYDDTQSFADAKRIPVYHGSQITGIDFGLPDYLGIKEFTVSGIVMDEDGAPLAEAEVRVYVYNCLYSFATDPNSVGIQDRYYTTISGDDGSYSITIDNRPWYVPFIIVSAHKEGFLPQFYDHKEAFYEADRIRVNKSEISDINFDLIPEPQYDFTMAGLITDPENNPIPGTIIITGNINTGQLYFAFSNCDGYYAFNGLPRGVYYTLFIAFGYGPELWDDAIQWADADPIILNQDLFDINAELQPVQSGMGDGTITGRITSYNGTELSGVLVTAINSDDVLVGYGFTDVNGDYNITGLSDGEYNIEAGKISYNATSSRVYVASGEHATVIVDMDIESNAVTSVETGNETTIPKNIFLGNNYPNPFNPSTTVNFGLSNPGDVQLAIYNILGQRIKVLINDNLPAGNYKAVWDGLDTKGQNVSSGLYLLVLETGEHRHMQKMILAK